ncbi:MAG: nickel-dependent lactate racemase [Promethearchaeota archaeon]
MKFYYGKEEIDINVESYKNVDIFYPEKQIPIENPIECIRNAIQKPINSKSLKNIVKEKITSKEKKICIVVSDATRPVPSNLILKALILELEEYGIYKEQIIILIATGLHRKSREDELKRIIGKDLYNNLKIIDHDAKDDRNLINLGIASDGTPILINKIYYKSAVKILTGYVEPHFFFGFSGGRKSIVPGIVGAKTIQINHSAKNINSKFSRFGIYEKNPLHKNALEISQRVGVDFIINVCINENHEITKVAAGDLITAHKMLVEYQLKKIFRKIEKPYDIVLCGNGGYPLDLNLYQAVKSMALGELAVKEGGTIISINECSDGIGIGQDKFKELIFSGMSPKLIHEKILNNEIIVPDQWEIQILCRILMKNEIYMISSLKENEIGNIGLKYAETPEEAINKAIKKHGKDYRILVLPNGPNIIPLLESIY